MPIPFIRRTETQATQASAASLSLHTHAPLILDLLMVSGISCLLFQVSHHSGAAQMDGPWRGWSWDSCWAVAPADDWDGLQQWRGCDNYSWDSENSFLLTANLFLLRSIAHWVLKCQNVAYRWVFFSPFEQEHLYFGHDINSATLSPWLWEHFCKQDYILSDIFFKVWMFCYLCSLKMEGSPILSDNQYEFLQLQKSTVNCKLL